MAILKIGRGELLVNDIPASEALADIEITNRFIKLAQTIRKISPRSDDFLYFTTIFMHASEASLIDQKTGEPKKDKSGKIITGGFDDNWRWSCSDSSILPYENANHDTFPGSELKLAHSKWRERPLCRDHKSDSVDGVIGIILDTHYDEKYKRIVGLVALDKHSYPELAHKVKSGQTMNVSMGCGVAKAVCVKCGNAAATEKDYCSHMLAKQGEINVGLSPIELSLVVSPADPQAKVIKILASMNNYVDQRNSLMESKDLAQIEKLGALDTSIKGIESQLNRLFSECSDNSCTFVKTADGHINLIKSAQNIAPVIDQASWKDFLDTAKHVDMANDYDKKALFDKLDTMRKNLDVVNLKNDNKALLDLADVMGSKNKYLHSNILQPVIEDLRSLELGQPQSMQEHQLTTPNGPDKDLGLDSGAEVTMPANEQQSGARVGKQVNPSETEPKPNKGGDLGPELGSASDRFQFGNMAALSSDFSKTANIDDNLNLLLQQTQEIESEMNTIKEQLDKTTNNAVNSTTAPVLEELKMNQARLKLRAAQRQALIEKQADKEEMCKVCEKMDCECEEDNKKEASFRVVSGLKCKECGDEVNDQKSATTHAETKHKGQDITFSDYKKSYWLGTTEPTPGKPQYKPDNGGEPKNRMNDKQMHQDGKMGGPEGLFPGDEKLKKEHLRAELEDRAMKRRAYWLGTEEPKPGKEQYKKDPLAAKDRFEDKHMHQDKSMGGDEGMFPGDEKLKKEHLRAEFVPGILRTKFTKLRNVDGSLNKKASFFEIFSGENKILKATAEEIYGEDLAKNTDTGSEKTYWDVLTSPEYGKEVMATIRSDGFAKVAYLLKGAQEMPELPPALDVGPGAAPANVPMGGAAPVGKPAGPGSEAPQKVEVDANELMALVSTMEETLNRLKTEVTGENEGDVKDVSVDVADSEDQEGAENVGAELQASLIPLAREVYAELDQSADELSLMIGYHKKVASLSKAKKAELEALTNDAVNEGKELIEEAETILAVAGKIPPGLKAYQDKQKGKKKGKDKDEDKKDKKTPKKDDKNDKKKKDEKDKKKPKKAEFIAALQKLAHDLEGEEGGSDEEVMEEMLGLEEPVEDELDKEMKAMGLVPENEAVDESCGMCGMAMDEAHYCTASAEDQLVKEALAMRKTRREAILKAAQDKKYDVVPDTHGLVDEAHKGSEANPTTQLDNKPAGDGAMIEGIDRKHDAMMDCAESVPTGKEGAAKISVKEAEIKAELEIGMKAKKAEDDKTKFRVKLRRAYDLGLMMQDKGMTPRTKEALDVQVDEIMKFDDQSFESYKRVVANTNSVVKTASSLKNVPQPGVRNDNSQQAESVGDEPDLRTQLKTLW